MHNTKLGLRLAFAVLLACSLSQAQVKELPLHPNDVRKFEVTFSGPDAEKIDSVCLQLRATTEAPANQVGFTTVIPCMAWLPPVPVGAPRIFHPEIRIPENAATGDYNLEVISRVVADAGGTTYTAGKQFQLHSFHVENPRTFTPPKITVKEQ